MVREGQSREVILTVLIPNGLFTLFTQHMGVKKWFEYYIEIGDLKK